MERNSLRNKSQVPILEVKVRESIALMARETFPQSFSSGAFPAAARKSLCHLWGFLCSNLDVEDFRKLQSEGVEGLILSCWVVPPTTNNPTGNRGNICGVICLLGKVVFVGYGPN